MLTRGDNGLTLKKKKWGILQLPPVREWCNLPQQALIMQSREPLDPLNSYSVEFEQAALFQPTYRRSTKQDGRKVLACWPTHDPRGHRKRKTCGSALALRLTRNVGCAAGQVRVFGHFRMCASPLCMKAGSWLSDNQLKRLLKDYGLGHTNHLLVRHRTQRKE